VPSVGAAAIQATFGTSYEATAWLLLLAPVLVSMAIEPALFLLADRYPRRWFVCAGLAAMAVAAGLAAAAPTPIVLAIALAVAYIGSGQGVALSQATLIDCYPDARERIMARWTLLGTAGDFLAPALMAALAALSLGWRTSYAIVGALTAVIAWRLLRAEFPPPAASPDDEDEESPGLVATLLLALRNRRLMFWLFAAALCNLMDEILVVFASLHLRDHLGAGPEARSAVLAACVAGEAIGLAVLDRLLHRMAPLRVLAISCAACAALYLAWVAAPTVWLSGLLMVGVGATAAPLYPIAAAQTYAALPGRSGAVNAAGHFFTPLTMGLPWLLGWIADQAGTATALVVLVAQPLLILPMAIVGHRRDARRVP